MYNSKIQHLGCTMSLESNVMLLKYLAYGDAIQNLYKIQVQHHPRS